MYRILYNESTIFDPYGNENEVVTDASMSVEINAAAYLDFTMSRLHPLYDTIAERDGVVTLYWDQKILFQGVIESIDMDIQGNKSISCVSALDYLNDTVVRPYSTIAGEQELTAPSSVDGYFQWLIDQHNDHVLDSGKLFEVGVNQGANLQQNNFIYRSSTNNPTTASEITDQLLDSLGGYLTMRYVEDRRVLDLYSDIHTMNAQIIDFGVNITDFSKTIDTKDQYTALLLKGGSPEFLGGDFEDGSFDYWVSHPNTPIATGAVHGGTYSSFFTEGNGEYINSSFFYAKKGARYKSTVWIKNERSSTIKAYPRYQVYEAGEWVGKTIDGGYDVPNDGEWHEYSFDFMPNLEDYVRIRPRWVFDTVGNDGNKRVYVDDFDFRRVEGDTDVAEDPISVSMVPDGGMQYDANILKTGDVIYDPTAVARYGYKEKVYEDSTITNVDDLLQAGVKELNKLKDPQIGLDIKAVDLALFMDGYDHLNVGDAVRVRSAIHDTDEFLMVTSITLDLQDPGQSEYNIGKAYDSLTGQQSGFLRSLNSGINSSLDAVASLDQTTKDQAIQIGAVENVANQAKDTANNAQNTANNAQNTANSNKEAIDSIKDAQTEYEKQLEQMQQGVADATEEIGQVNERIDGMNSEIESAKSDIDSLRSSTETELQNVKQSVSDVQSDVDAVTQKASDLASDLDGTKATVEQVTTDLGEVKTTVSNAATKADQALQVSTSASQTATEAQTTATSAYQDAQSALTQSSTASQTANAVKTELETKYSTTDEIAEQYATKSLVEQTSQSVTSTVEATYATKATVEALENIANNAVQTWMGSGVPTLSNKPASDWTTAELKSQHSGDIYYDSGTGYSYRFGSSDGKNYSWALIKDTDITKAVADAAKAQQTAEGVSDEVTQLKTDIPATYATKTEVKQTTDSIKSTVSEAASTANSALSKVSSLEVSVDGIDAKVEENASDIADAVKTTSQVSQRVDSLTSTIAQVSGDVNAALSQSYLTNPDFETGDTTGWDFQGFNKVEVNSTSPATGTYKVYVQPDGSNAQYIFNKKQFPVSEGQKYRITLMMNTDTASTNPMNFGLVQGGYTDFNHSVNFTKTPTGIGYSRYETVSGTVTIPSGWKTAQFRFSTQDQSYTTMRLDSFSIVDVTEGSNAQSTANSALSQSSTVQQELTSFKTSVQQTYETKNDALSKQSSLQQSVNNLRTEVSETYTTKTEFENLQVGGTNLVKLGGYAFNGNLTNTSYSKDDDLYKFTVPANLSDNTWGYGINQRGIGYVYAGIPWQRYGILSFYIHADRACTINIDANTQAFAGSTGATSGGNDHDTTGSRAHSSYSIPANQWTQVWMRWLNSNPNASTGNPNKVDLYDNSSIGIKSQSSAINVQIKRIKFEEGTKPTDWSPCPADMLTSDQAAQTYSTKSYVDQTARTVSLGVVEEYKDGQHGSALATQSDITATKNSITQTVSQTYTTKTEFNNLQVGGTNIARDTQAFGHNGVSSTEEGYLRGYVNRTNGTYKGLTVRNIISSDGTGVVVCEYLVTNVKHSEYYTLSFWAKGSGRIRTYFYGPSGYIGAKAVSATNGSGGTTFANGQWNMTVSSSWQRYFVVYQTAPSGGTSTDKYMLIRNDNDMASCDVCGVMIERGNKASDWSASPLDASATYATKTEVKHTSDSLTVTISSAMSKAESAATAASNAQNTANTANTTANTAKNNAAAAQSTANKANSNAQNAQNRVGTLETCIKMTSDGVRVGKISNGNFTGYSALVNSAGSFDVLDGSGAAIAKFSQYGLNVKATSSRSMYMGVASNQYGYIGSTPTLDGATAGQGFDVGMTMGFLQGSYLNVINNLGGIGIAGKGIQLTPTGGNRVKIGTHDVRGAGIILFDRDDNVSYGTINIATGYKFSDFNWILCSFRTNDNTYFCQAAYHPNGKNVLFGQMGVGGSSDQWIDNSSAYYKVALWNFNGTQAIRRTTKEIALANMTPAVSVNDNVLKLVAIIGFDYYSEK